MLNNNIKNIYIKLKKPNEVKPINLLKFVKKLSIIFFVKTSIKYFSPKNWGVKTIKFFKKTSPHFLIKKSR